MKKYIDTPRDVEVLRSTINHLKGRSFEYLYNFQLENAGLKRFDFKIDEMKPCKNINFIDKSLYGKMCYIIEHNFISDATRELYSKSDLMHTELTPDIISKHPEIFPHNFIVFIDGRVNLYAKILCYEEYTYIIFDKDIPLNQIKNEQNSVDDFLIKSYNKSDVTFLIIPNGNRVSGPTIVKDLEKYGGKIPFEYSEYKHTNLNVDKTNSNYLTFISTNNTTGMVLYDVVNEDGNFIFNTSRYRQQYGRFLLDSMEIPNLSYEKVIKPFNKFFTLDIVGCPIPPENIFIFERTEKGYRLFNHDITVKLHYPNVYELSRSSDKELSIMVMYYTPSKDWGIKFENYSELYFKYTEDVVRKYQMNIVESLIKDYNPFKLEYSLNDYYEDPTFNHEDSLEYNKKIFTEYFNDTEEILMTYFDKLFLLDGTPTHIMVDKIDLSRRVRYDSYDEGGDIEFDKRHYIFGLNFVNDDDFINTNYIIDGLLINPTYKIKSDEVYYLYFSEDVIKPNSIIEIDRHAIHEKVWTTRIKSYDEVHEFNFSSETYDRMYMYGLSIYDENGRQIPNTEYNIYIMNYKGDWVETDDYFELINHFKFKIKNYNLNFQNLIFKMQYITRKIDIDPLGDAVSSAKSVPTKLMLTEHSPGQLKGYINGRKVPQHLLRVRNGEIYSSDIMFNNFVGRHSTDNLSYFYSPKLFRQLAFIEKIDSNGIVDLRPFIKKPFNLKWNEVYLNGRKLNKDNINILTNTKIQLVDVSSLYNLELLEREFNNDDEWIIEKNNVSYSDKVFELVKDSITNDNIVNLEPDAFSEIWGIEDLEHVDCYSSYLLNKEFINCGEFLSDEEYGLIERNFSTMVQDNGVLLIDAGKLYNHHCKILVE